MLITNGSLVRKAVESYGLRTNKFWQSISACVMSGKDVSVPVVHMSEGVRTEGVFEVGDYGYDARGAVSSADAWFIVDCSGRRNSSGGRQTLSCIREWATGPRLDLPNGNR